VGRLLKQELSWHSNKRDIPNMSYAGITTDMRYAGSTQTQDTLIILKVPKQELSWHSNMRDIGDTQTGATSVSLTDMSYIDSTQTQATLIILKSSKWVDYSNSS